MSKFYDEVDAPLFVDKDEDGDNGLLGSTLSSKSVSAMERIAKTKARLDENNRKNLSHKFSIKFLWFVLVGLCVITVCEYFVDIENEYTRELFEFFKYIGTTLIGYLFASHKKEIE